MDVVNIIPPVETEYHFNAVPVADNPATVPELQKFWSTAIGAFVIFKVTATDFLLILSHEFKVCET